MKYFSTVLLVFVVLFVGCIYLGSSATVASVDAEDKPVDPQVKARTSLAWSTTSSSVLVELSFDKNIEVRRGVAASRDTPPEVLARLASDQDGYVREDVARSKSTPPQALVVLAKDIYLEIKREVAKNPNTPAEALRVLAADPGIGWLGRLWVAKNPNVTADTLKKLVNDYDKVFDIRRLKP